MSDFENAMTHARADAWDNPLLGLGGAKDPTADTTFSIRATLADHVLHALYVENHFAAKIVEALPKSALRTGWSIGISGDPKEASELREAYAAREAALGVAGEMLKGACWGRAFGGAITIIGADDGRASGEPLDEGGIERVRFLHTFDRRDVRVYGYYNDPTHPKFRMPEVFEVWPQVVRARGGGSASGWVGGFLVHESRCVVWPGQATTESRRIELQGWDDSVLERTWDALKQIGEDYGAKSLLLARISQSIFKVKNLWEMLAGKEKERLQTRMELLDRSRSRAKAIVLDSEESFENSTQPLAGVESMLDKAILRLAAAADMPATILMGQSPAGFDATGESDLEVWSGEVESWRRLELQPRHARIAKLILLDKSGPTEGAEPPGWTMQYRPVRQPSPKEEAEVRKLEAEADALNIDKGVYPAEAAAFRYGPRGQDGIVLDAAELDERLERRRELAKAPPKDNAELGTIGPRTQAVLDVVAAVKEERIPRSSGIAILTKIHRHAEEDAEAFLGPEIDLAPAPPPAPGPAPDPKGGSGGGAPPPVPNPGVSE